MKKILGLVLVAAIMGMLVGCSTTTPEVKNTFPQPKGLNVKGKVFGTKQDQSYNEPGDTISGATVVLTGAGQTLTASSDANGEFSFLNLPQTSYDEGYILTTTKDGYQRNVITDVYLDSDNILPDNSTSVREIMLDNHPVVLSVSPAPGTAVSAASQNITVVFNEAMDKSSVRPTIFAEGVRTFAIADTQTLTTSWSADSKTLNITTGSLLANTRYRFRLDPGSHAKDLEGNLLDTGGGTSSNAGGLSATVYNNYPGSEDYDYRTASGGIPGAPTALQVTVNGALPANMDYDDANDPNNDVDLTWFAPTSGGPISRYRFYVSKSLTGPWNFVAESPLNSASTDVDEVNKAIHGESIGASVDPVAQGNAAFINYKVYFKVVAYNADGESNGVTAEAQESTGPQLAAFAKSGRSLGPVVIGDELDNGYYLEGLTPGTDTKIAYIYFEEPVDPSTITAANFDHKDSSDNPKGNITSATLLTTYSSDLTGSGIYSVVKIITDTDFADQDKIAAGTGVKDLAGNPVVTGTGDTSEID